MEASGAAPEGGEGKKENNKKKNLQYFIRGKKSNNKLIEITKLTSDL